MKLIIPISSGKKFALISGDNNKIHLSNKYASNSIYGRKICHGCNFLIKFLKLKEISKYTSKKEYSIYISFIDAIDYDIGIDIIKKKNVFKIYQNKVIKSEIVFKKIIEKPIVKIKKINYQQKNKYNNNLAEILEVLSKYVGTIYPGEHSIIKSININYKYKSTNNQKQKIVIFSKKLSKGYPFILNTLFFKNYVINFETIERPIFKKLNNSISAKTKKIVSNIKNNTLIIGASSGLGNEILKIYSHNKKIKIYASYYRNNINIKKKNIYIFKLNVLNDFLNIINLIKKNDIKNIYYMATPKIILKKHKKYKENYYKYYYHFPMKLLKKLNNYKVNFYYPSTIFINQNNYYGLFKKKFEIFAKKYNKSNKDVFIRTPRLPQIHTRQNLNFLNKKFISFTELINKNQNLRDILFFKK